MAITVSRAELQGLEDRVAAAFRTGRDSSLDVIGYGESSMVLRLETPQGALACKRLPTFADRARFDRYQERFEQYLGRLRQAGVAVVDSELRALTAPSGEVAAYCVQEALPAGRLCSALLRTEDEAWVRGFFTRFLDTVDRVVAPTLGLDAQASNWVEVDGEPHYLDVTTPFLRDERGRELLDVRLFVTSLPWVLRTPVRVTMTGRILDKYFSVRGVVLDFLGNLHKESLGHLVPFLVELANARLERPLGVQEVARYYQGDATTWTVLQRLRRADRLWQLKVRRRPYCFLLPPEIDR
ncbi:DUF6206 family protein [Umezawaea tangerina]|uniref:Uncharacterized protein n=1 Tax=Umezawaea tangerina TaxID=84725 RepID=A0A2T0STS9_9PSEU|nr:DUF6206 family protein [Umezawaea tangerina]PRY36819.1 hypothetical protein CLV43_111191 [Umezawaea tangerina]